MFPAYGRMGKRKPPNTVTSKWQKGGTPISECGECHWISEEGKCRIWFKPYEQWLFKGYCEWLDKKEL